MSKELAIRINNLSKLYRVYKKPRDRLLDALGLTFFSKDKYEEFWALNDINLSIERGSKVALLGRNGAGKSTLLKIIAGSLKATSGQVEIQGKVSALMELGTGFHPEFSGRENIYASLSYMGIVGQEAKQKYIEIVDFSELEDFIDKPVKTYSAGMYARLAFATSTAIVPEILIIDEILGAGDAYFINKSIERMKRLTQGGTTVLFVSHDISSVQKLCDEAVWIDKGKVVQAGSIMDITAVYLASIRKQENRRLKAKNIRLKHQNFKTLEESTNGEVVYFHFVTERGSPKDKHPISKITISSGKGISETLQLGDAQDTNPTNDLFLLVDKDTINWSGPQETKDKRKYYRSFENVGGEFQHALFAYKVQDLEELRHCEIQVEYEDCSKEPVYLEYYDGEQYLRIGKFEGNADSQWKTSTFSVARLLSEMDEKKKEAADQRYMELLKAREDNNRIYGSGEVLITSVQFLDDEGNETLVFTSNGYKKLRVHYYAHERIKFPVFVAAYYLLDGNCAMQLLSNKDEFEVKEIYGEGFIDLVFDPLYLGRGSYHVSIAIFKEINLVDNIEPPAYDLHDKMYEIKVEQPFGINVELGIVNHPIIWEHRPG